MKKQISMMVLMACPIAALAQDSGAQFVQNGQVLVVTPGQAAGIATLQVQAAAAPFALTFPPFDCDDLTETAFMRFVPMALMPEVARIVTEAAPLDEGEARNGLLWPYGSSMAVPAGVMDRVILTTREHRGYAWEFMYAEGDRFAHSGPGGAEVTVDIVYETWEGRDMLAEGAPFAVMVGRPRCDQGAPRMAIDVFEVSFGIG